MISALWAAYKKNQTIYVYNYDSIYQMHPHILNPNIDGNFGIIVGKDSFSSLFGWLEIFQISLIGIFILLLALFFPRSGRFTRFLNKLSFEYIILVLLLNSFDIVIRLSKVVSLEDLLAFTSKDIYTPEESLNFFTTKVALLQSDLLYNKIFILFSLIVIAIIFYGLVDRFFIANSYDIEFTVLIFLIYIGSLILFLAHNLIEFALALEVITLGSYALAAYERKSKFSAYAGVQYFIIGSIPSGMLIFSLALMYKTWGTLAIEDIDVLLNKMHVTKGASYDLNADTIIGTYGKSRYDYEYPNKLDFVTFWGSHDRAWAGMLTQHWFYPGPAAINPDGNLQGILTDDTIIKKILDWTTIYGPLHIEPQLLQTSAINDKEVEMVLALLLVMFNLLFKITAAPFNFWAPSVYGNAPVASATFLSIYSKVAIIFAMVKLLGTIFFQFHFLLESLLFFSGIFSIIFGMAGAFSEKIIKRFYVYSSMGHVGFMVIAMGLSTVTGFSAVFHYLFVYVLSSYLMWFVLIIMGRSRNNLVHFGSLKNIDKWVATIFALLVFSMSGIPPLGGFFVKLDVLIALLDSSEYYINFLLLVFSVISFFYYLRLIKIIFFDERKDFVRDLHISEERLWIVAVLFIILLFYMFIIHKPLLFIEREALLAFLTR